MTDESHADTLATAVANISNIVKSVDYLVQRSDASAIQHTEVISKLAVISSKQDDTKARLDKGDDQIRDMDKRITQVESFQHTQLKLAGTVGGLIALVVTGAIEWIKK